ncbi:ATP synthase F0 subcomplex A subunit [Ulvibacter sp. MAR_2010_11]|uniref:F0F1 ATP synthase subunit A n=1 Tax=Ulvibacter sp. MAR_2010_11 TaxID=1250229 RepID=UPI000CBEA8D8|nr:F0F1 ATP synthase subunit A [Ulvibacter sp. MAR_2010_11]PKA82895.1 ATP synthase F0 subcomplex A subunit [Ulvibacter sp. MAR_2010_11]
MKTTNFNAIKSLILGVFFILAANPTFATASPSASDGGETEKEFDVTSMIMHHIKDAHDFHIMDWDGHAVSIPLPVILWTENGLVTFMSSEFHHDDTGTVVVEKGGQKFVKYHEEIYYASEAPHGASTMTPTEGNHPEGHKPLDFSITKLVFSMFLSIVLLLVIFGLSARKYSKSGVPKGIAKFTEPLVLFIRDEVARPNIGEKHYKRFMPFLLTLFFFIWINNVMGLIPFFPFSANLSGNIAFTLVLAVITFVITTVVAKKDYWKHIFWMPGVPVPMKIFLAPIEFLGIFIKPISLMIRLFANITAGHIIVLSLISLIFIAKSIWISPASVFFSVFISLIEVLVVAIQAYIFTMLSALYIGSAMEEHEHEH